MKFFSASFERDGGVKIAQNALFNRVHVWYANDDHWNCSGPPSNGTVHWFNIFKLWLITIDIFKYVLWFRSLPFTFYLYFLRAKRARKFLGIKVNVRTANREEEFARKYSVHFVEVSIFLFFFFGLKMKYKL